MNRNGMQEVAKHAIQLIVRFFSGLSGAERDLVPSVLKSAGTWMASFDESILGIFYLDESEQQRVEQYQERGWPPFPGFMVGEGKMPAGVQAAITMGGSCGFRSSNHTINLIAFEVSPRASFTVTDHFHEIRDSSGEEFKYHVALAFVLGISQGEQLTDVDHRLSELLEYSRDVWRKLR
jgi:hypothetical protein